MQTRAVGIYPAWIQFPPESSHRLLQIEHVNGDGSVDGNYYTERDAAKLRDFLEEEPPKVEVRPPCAFVICRCWPGSLVQIIFGPAE